MSNAFLPKGGRVRPPKRNKKDLTRQTVFTSDWGKLYPFLCQEVIPGASYKLNASVGFRAMQTKFPLQSRIRTMVSFFYVRCRCVYPDFEDFIFGTKGAEHGVVSPWLKIPNWRSPNANVLRTGSLGDALGVATTKGSSGSYQYAFSPRSFWGVENLIQSMTQWSPAAFREYMLSRVGNTINRRIFNIGASPNPANFYGYYLDLNVPNNHIDSLGNISITSGSTSTSQQCFFLVLYDSEIVYNVSSIVTLNPTSFSVPLETVNAFNELVDSSKTASIVICSVQASGIPQQFISNPTDVSVIYVASTIVEPLLNPHLGSTPDDPISALPFRCYDITCNYYFRNDLNSPLMINGEPQYNKFLRNYDGGEDTTVYDFHYHNWELDRFTSAVPTPQFGEAPLVGLTYNVGADIDAMNFTFQGEDQQEYQATLGVKEGKVVSIMSFDENLPSGNLHNLMDMVNAGFSINTLRNVNSFQRFLENCQRRGLRYRNQLQSHFGVSVDYPDIDIPQYIGGFSDWAQVGQVTNLAEMPDSGLGDYVGTLSGMSSGKHDITVYTPEHGFIIGIYCIYPTPIYTQAEPKYLKKLSPFDYFQTEFNKIGKVPIHYREICPLQCDENHKLNDVFGYQIPWYDYLDAQDTAHGDFRTTLRDFVVQRLWDSPPELCEDFVRVNPTQLNDIFTVRNIADAYGSNSRFLCSAITNMTALLPIAVPGQPALE